MRTVAWLIVLVVVAGLFAPVAAHPRAPEESAGAICPMMAHRPSTTPCIGVPCPCHHGSHASLLPNGERVGVPGEAVAVTAPVMPWASATLCDSRCAAGFLSPIDHPPHPAV